MTPRRRKCSFRDRQQSGGSACIAYYSDRRRCSRPSRSRAAAPVGLGPSKVGAPVSPVTLRLGDLDSGSLTPGLKVFIREVKQLSQAIVIKVETAPIADDQYETHSQGHRRGQVGPGVDRGPVPRQRRRALRGRAPGPVPHRQLRDRAQGRAGLDRPTDHARHVQGRRHRPALLPDHLRYLVTRDPIGSPADLKGKRIRVYGSSRSQIAAFRALGGHPYQRAATQRSA